MSAETQVSAEGVPGTRKPADTVACLAAGQTRESVGTYQLLGYLHITTDPAVAGIINVGLVGHSTQPLNDWGALVAVLPGTYLVAFGAVNGYQEPDAVQIVTVTAGMTTSVTGHYVLLGG
jgi:hypothetical protein